MPSPPPHPALDLIADPWESVTPARPVPAVAMSAAPLSPPPIRTLHHLHSRLGSITEIRRGRQLVRHDPGRAPDMTAAEGWAWCWSLRQSEGYLWIETVTSPVHLYVHDAELVFRDADVASCWDPRGPVTHVTVVRGRARLKVGATEVELVAADRIAITANGGWIGPSRMATDTMLSDPWVRANQELANRSRL